MQHLNKAITIVSVLSAVTSPIFAFAYHGTPFPRENFAHENAQIAPDGINYGPQRTSYYGYRALQEHRRNYPPNTPTPEQQYGYRQNIDYTEWAAYGNYQLPKDTYRYGVNGYYGH